MSHPIIVKKKGYNLRSAISRENRENSEETEPKQ